jgi:hypothetical protein
METIVEMVKKSAKIGTFAVLCGFRTDEHLCFKSRKPRPPDTSGKRGFVKSIFVR